MKNQPGFMKKQPWTSKTNLEPWKSKTNLNPWKSVITDMEPWKTNLQPSKLTRSCTGWLWVVQVVTGDSQEEVLIFRDKQTLHHNIYIITIIIIKITRSGQDKFPPPWGTLPVPVPVCCCDFISLWKSTKRYKYISNWYCNIFLPHLFLQIDWPLFCQFQSALILGAGG